MRVIVANPRKVRAIYQNERVLIEMAKRFQAAFPLWDGLLAASFLSPEKKTACAAVLAERKARLQI